MIETWNWNGAGKIGGKCCVTEQKMQQPNS